MKKKKRNMTQLFAGVIAGVMALLLLLTLIVPYL